MIYFLHIISGARAGTTKVGTSITPGERAVTIVNDLRCSAMLHAIEPGGLGEERSAHEALDHHRVMFNGHREHFRTCDVLEYLSQRGVRVLDLPYECGRESQLAALHALDVSILREAVDVTRSELASCHGGKAVACASWLLSRKLLRLERAEFRLARSSGSDVPRIRAVIAKCHAMLSINADNVYGKRARRTLDAKLLQLAEAERLMLSRVTGGAVPLDGWDVTGAAS